MASEGYEDADISVLEGMNHRTWHLDLPDVLEGSRVPLTRLFDYMPHVSAIEVRCGDRTTFVRRVFASDKSKSIDALMAALFAGLPDATGLTFYRGDEAYTVTPDGPDEAELRKAVVALSRAVADGTLSRHAQRRLAALISLVEE